MSNAHIVGGVCVDLAEGPARTSYGRDPNGRPFAHILIGPDLALSVTYASRQAITELRETLDEVLAWHDQQAAKAVA